MTFRPYYAMKRLEEYGNTVITPIDFETAEMKEFIKKHDLTYEYVENKYADFVVLRTKVKGYKFTKEEWEEAQKIEDWIIELNKKRKAEEELARAKREKNEFRKDTAFLRRRKEK